MAFTSREATAFLISRTDWQYMFNCFAICHKIGYHFVHTPSGDPNVVLTQCGSDEGAPGTTSTSVRVDGCQSWAGISFLNGQFGGTVQVGNTNEGPVKFTSCGFWGNDLDSVAVLAGSGLTTFIGCHFASWAQRNKKAPAIALRRGRLTVDGCEFQKSRRHIALNHIALDKGASAAVIMGNHFHGPARISNQIGSRASIATNATN
jgi:hypothetical protein